ncbi:unnamed protein product [Tenebrio molitor]|nr:unnamed protein product [Tenebrio molitor]
MNWGTKLWVSLADQNFIFPPEKLLYITAVSTQLHFCDKQQAARLIIIVS